MQCAPKGSGREPLPSKMGSTPSPEGSRRWKVEIREAGLHPHSITIELRVQPINESAPRPPTNRGRFAICSGPLSGNSKEAIARPQARRRILAHLVRLPGLDRQTASGAIDPIPWWEGASLFAVSFKAERYLETLHEIGTVEANHYETVFPNEEMRNAFAEKKRDRR
jgi:hypothetical protein